jgi:hypothetical protein
MVSKYDRDPKTSKMELLWSDRRLEVRIDLTRRPNPADLDTMLANV